MALKDTPKLVNHALATLFNIIETDTDISTVDLNLLENLNTNQSLNYIKLEQNLNVLEKDAKRLQELRKYKCVMEALCFTNLKTTNFTTIHKC